MITPKRYAGLKYNDVVDGNGVCVSLWMQGCPLRCKGCHNSETWEIDGGVELPSNLPQQILTALSANNVKRNFSILGGEPFMVCQNKDYTLYIINKVRNAFPDIEICVWTGYTTSELKKILTADEYNFLFQNVDYLITGRYKQELRDLTLKWRGSTNQSIIATNRKKGK